MKFLKNNEFNNKYGKYYISCMSVKVIKRDNRSFRSKEKISVWKQYEYKLLTF